MVDIIVVLEVIYQLTFILLTYLISYWINASIFNILYYYTFDSCQMSHMQQFDI